jgi:hypothetical protein
MVMPILQQSDITVRGRNGNVVLVGECRNALNLDREAAQWIYDRQLVNYQRSAPFLLLVSQDRGYLWNSAAKPGQPPAYEFPMAPVIQRYAPELGSDDRLLGSQLDVLVGQWLSELSVGLIGDTEAEDALRSAGVVASLQGADINLEAAA